MATKKSNRCAAGIMPRSRRHALVAQTGVWSSGTGNSLSAGDVIQMVKAPMGSMMIYMLLTGNSGDALVTVGDTVSTGRYMSSITIGSTSTVLRTINVMSPPYVYSVDSTIDLTIGTVSNGTATGGFTMTCIFAMDQGVAS